MNDDNFKTGLVSVVGRPNVGKSSIVNALIDNDLSITSVHPHTTRRQIRAIDTTQQYQVIYIDTPGIHKPRNEFGEEMNEHAYDALMGADLVLVVFDASKPFGKGDQFIADRVSSLNDLIVVLNKCDVLNSVESIATKAKEASDLIPNATDIFMVSAFTKKNIHLLKQKIIETIPISPQLFDEETKVDLSTSELVAELYREQLIRQLKDEIPQKISVVATQENSDSKVGSFEIKVLVESNSQKAIVIGKAGSMLEKVGSMARKKIELLLNQPVFLRVNVQVRG